MESQQKPQFGLKIQFYISRSSGIFTDNDDMDSSQRQNFLSLIFIFKCLSKPSFIDSVLVRVKYVVSHFLPSSQSVNKHEDSMQQYTTFHGSNLASLSSSCFIFCCMSVMKSPGKQNNKCTCKTTDHCSENCLPAKQALLGFNICFNVRSTI